MADFLQQLVNGLALGAIYALIALGYTMVYGVLRFINFAHGDILMLGAFAGWGFCELLQKTDADGNVSPRFASWDWLNQPGWPKFIIVLLFAMAICALLGMAIERFAYRPLRSRPKITVLITAIGVSLLIQTLAQICFGATNKSFPVLIEHDPVTFACGEEEVIIEYIQMIILVITPLLLGILTWLVMGTKTGLAMRALSLNPTATALMGVDNNKVISRTFALGSALAAAGGILYALYAPSIDPQMGVMPGLKAFAAAVLGGIGSLAGAALGALILGLTETWVGASEDFSQWKDAIAFAVLILVLLFKPTGLLGRSDKEKV
ncbi:MAG: hypothetical protein RL095_3465 [Verrucomicrobiota bacterium]|jgi:branched-chain amino acid transport system permease protein